jgi:asparagine synthase (glutamine-hydrolysing)
MPSRGRGWRREADFFLASPTFPRAFQCLSTFALEAGVELRSPLYDRRIVEFASGRPREERNTGRETKRLLRRAMQGLLPDDVLAPRPFRTGITTAYSDRKMRESWPRLMQPLKDSLRLEELGIVDRRALERGWSEFERTGANDLKISLFLTLHVELWLRAHETSQGMEALNARERTAVAFRH